MSRYDNLITNRTAKLPGDLKIRPKKSTDWEGEFLALWLRFHPDLPPVREHRFHPTRKWRFDFAWPASMVAVEIEGGIYTRGRHVRPGGFVKDAEKYNAAAIQGWAVLRFTSEDLTKRPLQTVAMVLAALRKFTNHAADEGE